jgi:hypothetical protein
LELFAGVAAKNRDYLKLDAHEDATNKAEVRGFMVGNELVASRNTAIA